MTLPFPQALQADTKSVSAKIPDDEVLIEFKRRVGYAAQTFLPELKQRPRQSAGIIYLGLCYLRELYQADRFHDADELCRSILERTRPEEGGGSGINCSYFDGSQNGHHNHGIAIQGSMNLYLPKVTSMKKRCAILLSIGANRAEKFKIGKQIDDAAKYALPDSDAWVETFQWKPQ